MRSLFARITAPLLVLVLAGGACTPSGVSLPKPDRPAAGEELAVATVEPASIDPSRVSDKGGTLVLKQICDTLVASDPDTGALVPGIAESWSISQDAKQITFKIRPKVKFHNGRDLVAQDLVFSMSRFANPATGSSQHFFFEKVAGYQDLRAGRATALSGVKAPDPRTLVVDLTGPFAEFPAIMSHTPAGVVIPEEEVAKGADAFAVKPVCTGPYMLNAPWTKGAPLVISRFGDYLASSKVLSKGGAGYFKSIKFVPAADSAASFDLFNKKTVHVAEVPVGQLSKPQVEKRLESRQNGLVSYIGLPVTRPPFDNPDLRRALHLATDRRKVVEDLLGGSRTVATGFLPEAANVSGSCPGGGVRSAEPKAAQDALRRAAIDPNSLKPTIYFNSAGNHEQWLQRVSDQWKSTLGIEPVLKPDEWKKYLDFLVQPGADGPFRLAWAVKYPSAEAEFGPLFAGGSLDNFTRYSSKEFDDLLAKARSTPEDKARAALYKQAHEILCRDMPAIVMWFGRSHVVFADEVSAASRQRLDPFGDPILRELGSKV